MTDPEPPPSESRSCRRVLFLCTGNYYRSRFAEMLFNHLARQTGLSCLAESRGLALELGIFNEGPISAMTVEGLRHRGISLTEPHRAPLPLRDTDLDQADLVIAVKEAEHRPYLAERFPDWPDRVRYWHVHDLDQSTPDEALSQIELAVTALIKELRAR